MTSDHRGLVDMLREAARKVESMPEHDMVHTITVTLDGRSRSNVSATIEYDVDHGDYIESADEPIVLT